MLRRYCVILTYALCLLLCCPGCGKNSGRDSNTDARLAAAEATRLREAGNDALKGLKPIRETVDLDQANPADAGLICLAECLWRINAPQNDPKSVPPAALDAIRYLAAADDQSRKAKAQILLCTSAVQSDTMKPEWVSIGEEGCISKLEQAFVYGDEDQREAAAQDAYVGLRALSNYLLAGRNFHEIVKLSRRMDRFTRIPEALQMLSELEFPALVIASATQEGDQRTAQKWANLILVGLDSSPPEVQVRSLFLFASALVYTDPQRSLDETRNYLDLYRSIESPSVDDQKNCANLCGIRATAHLFLGQTQKSRQELGKLIAEKSLKLGPEAKAVLLGYKSMISGDLSQWNGKSTLASTDQKVFDLAQAFSQKRYAVVATNAKTVLASLNASHALYPLILDMALEADLNLGRIDNDHLLDRVSAVTDSYWKLWKSGVIPNTSIGRFQEAFENPSTRGALALADKGKVQDGFVLLDAGRGWSIMGNTSSDDAPDQLLPAMPEFEKYRSWIAAHKIPTAVLSYAVTRGSAPSVFVLTAGGLRRHALPATFNVLQKNIAAWKKQLETAGPLTTGELKTSRNVCASIIDPLVQDLAGIKRLIIVPDGPVRQISFSALVLPDGKKRMIDQYEIAISPAIHLLVGSAGTGGSGKMGFFGVPGSKGTAELAPFKSLILGLARKSQDIVSIGDEFRPTTTQKLMPDLSEACFFTHGIISSQNPLDSYLLASGVEGRPQQITIRDILNTKNHLQHVALWACESAMGPNAGGEGLLGIAWAFQAAGAKSVIASKWSVDVASTAMLAETFYIERFTHAASTSEALRTAMQTVRQNPARANPYYWAAFDVYGDFG